MTASDAPTPRWFALPLLALGIVGFAAAWTLVSLAYERPFAWLAVLAAADMALLLGIGRWRVGLGRALLAALATIATIVLANFCIVAGQVGAGMGLLPWESAMKLGPAYAWELARLANDRIDLAWYALGVVTALVAGFRAWSTPKDTPRS